MKYWPIFLCMSLTVVSANAAGIDKTGLTVPVRYEGGTASLSQGKVKVAISGDEIVFSHGGQTLAVPLKSISGVAFSTDVRRRFGASVLGIVPKLHLATEEGHYVGLSWAGGEQASKGEVVLKLSNGEYREFLATLETLTGRKAVNTHEILTGVRYGL